jgi:hypothetical protein
MNKSGYIITGIISYLIKFTNSQVLYATILISISGFREIRMYADFVDTCLMVAIFVVILLAVAVLLENI